MSGVAHQDKHTHFRLSRFSVDLKTWVFDPSSELVLIDQEDESVYHQGGAMFFHPKEGFLYLAVGDECLGGCKLGNCQRIDKDLFSGVLRLDVDRRGGDVSHSITRQPATGKTDHYFIPNDNPFVGQPGVLEEFYAIGLRARIATDRRFGGIPTFLEALVGIPLVVACGLQDVELFSQFRNRKNGITSFGQDTSEELYVLTLGRNWRT